MGLKYFFKDKYVGAHTEQSPQPQSADIHNKSGFNTLNGNNGWKSVVKGNKEKEGEREDWRACPGFLSFYIFLCRCVYCSYRLPTTNYCTFPGLGYRQVRQVVILIPEFPEFSEFGGYSNF